jgi:hypothetical protein
MSALKYLAVLMFAVLPLWSQGNSSGAQPAAALPVWSQADSSEAQPPADDAAMVAPAPISNEGYSLAFAAETPRSNYLRAGLNFGTVYDDHVFTNLSTNGQAVRDVRYSIWPALSLEQTRSRFRWDLSYSPGFTFHQSYSSVHEFDHSLGLGLEYRLSPHVTLSLKESFQKTSGLLNLSQQSAVPSTEVPMNGPNVIVPPTTPRIANSSDVQITHQFGPNVMVGAKGSLTGLWYPDRSTLPGLFDSTGRAAEGFYTHRLSGRHYIGVTYSFQQLLTHPDQSETETHSTLLFYTLYLPPTLTISVFAGPEHSDTHGGISLPSQKWSPAGGASFGWHGPRAGFVASYERKINSGGGLSGAVLSNSAAASVRWQLARTVTTGIEAGYSTNSLSDSVPLAGGGGHTWSGTASLQHPMGERMAVRMGYTRLHQSYTDIAAIANAPNQNSVWISLSYQFERPLGR